MSTEIAALDLFAGTGWGVACRRMSIAERGVEIMPEAVATREAAGMETVYSDVWDGLSGAEATPDHSLLIASPPCQTFSVAGGGSGRRALDQVLGLIRSDEWKRPAALRRAAEVLGDDRTGLVLTPLAHVWRDLPEVVVLEQVPPVLPVWQAYAEVMRGMGYNVWTGVLNAEQYGVPQTRRRAVLIANLWERVSQPVPTHSRYHQRDRSRLDAGVLPWVSMAEALGWGMTHRPYPTVAAGTASGGQDPAMLGGSGARAMVRQELEAGRWILRSNYGTSGDSARRGERASSDPAPTVTSKVNRNRIVTAKGETALSVEEASLLQSYPAEFPWAGSRTSSYQQVGNAVPPLLAEAVLREAIQ